MEHKPSDIAEVLVFHHGHGLTAGVRRFAETLRQAGHTVHLPDLFEGRRFSTLEEGIGYTEEVGFGTLIECETAAAEWLPAKLVYLGFSLGVLPAQKLAQTPPGAKGALLLEACLPVSEFGGTWPPGQLPLQPGRIDSPTGAARVRAPIPSTGRRAWSARLRRHRPPEGRR